MMKTICFGEIMARFSPPGHLRIGQSMPGTIEVTFAGAEVNTGVAIARLGGAAEFVTALPLNPVADAALGAVRATGVGVQHVVQCDEGRCGLYFVETGAAQRGGLVIYDREGSTFALSDAAAYPWPEILRGASWFHTTGISAGVSRRSADATLAGVQAAKKAGLTVSCDLNFRRKLWRWERGVSAEELARRTLADILPHVDLLLGSAHDIAGTLGEEFAGQPSADLQAHRELARRAVKRFPNLRWVAMTLRENQSASENQWGALLFRGADDTMFASPQVDGRYQPYEIQTIVDRVGTGDVFAGALIFALQTPDLAAPQRAVDFATAASCLAHSTVGDFFQGTRAEVDALTQGQSRGFLSR